MKYRMMIILLKRLMKSADDIHPNTTSERGIKNNILRPRGRKSLASELMNFGVNPDTCLLESLG